MDNDGSDISMKFTRKKPPPARRVVTVRLTDEQHDRLKRLTASIGHASDADTIRTALDLYAAKAGRASA